MNLGHFGLMIGVASLGGVMCAAPALAVTNFFNGYEQPGNPAPGGGSLGRWEFSSNSPGGNLGFEPAPNGRKVSFTLTGGTGTSSARFTRYFITVPNGPGVGPLSFNYSFTPAAGDRFNFQVNGVNQLIVNSAAVNQPFSTTINPGDVIRFQIRTGIGSVGGSTFVITPNTFDAPVPFEPVSGLGLGAVAGLWALEKRRRASVKVTSEASKVGVGEPVA